MLFLSNPFTLRPIFAGVLLSGVTLAAPLQAQESAFKFLDDEAEAKCTIAFQVNPAATGKLTMALDYQGDKNTYLVEMTPGQAQLVLVTNGTRRLLASGPVNWKPKSNVVLQRRAWLTRLIVNGTVVLTGYDGTYSDGQIGFRGTGWSAGDAKVQPVEDIRFDDDFTRAGSEGDSNWKTGAGQFRLTASSSSINSGNAQMSSNPFAFEALAGSRGFSSAGRWFWDNYDARVAVRPSGRSTVGLAAYVQDANNYLAFLWNSTEGPASRKLVRVRNGVATELAAAKGAFLPRQWYQLGLRTSPGYIEAIIDGVPVLRARDESFGQGAIGLISQDSTTLFDDISVRSYDFYRQDFRGLAQVWTPEQGGAWVARGGKWSAKNGLLTSTGQAGSGAERALLTGRGDWDGYRVLVSTMPANGVTGGLLAGYKDAKNYMLFRWAGPQAPVPYKGKQQVVSVVGGKATVVQEASYTLDKLVDREGWVRLSLEWNTGALSVSAGNEILAQAGRDALPDGHFGLWAQGAAPTNWKDAVIFFPPPPEPQKVAPRMEEDSYMVGWASPSGEWPPTAGENGLEFWHTGEFFGNAELIFPWRASWRGSLEVALRANRNQFNSGYILRAEPSEDRANLVFNLTRGGARLATASVPLSEVAGPEPDATGELLITLQGKALSLTNKGKPILTVQDAAPPEGTALALRSLGFRLRADRLKANSATRDDYTFTEAPTDFYAPQGEWSIFSRWPCYGDWSFFGGIGLNPVLWSKRTYGGDTVVEMYAHNQMDLLKEVGYSRPGDLNISLAADGKNVSSGYSFIVAGHNNTRSQLMRGGKVVAETDKPEARFEKPINHYMRWHRRWVYIRAEARHAIKDGKPGVNISLTVDDVPLLTYFDADPLPLWNNGGRVAFWTVDSSLMIARAKIEAQRPGLKALPVGMVDPVVQVASTGRATLEPRPVKVDGLPSAIVNRTAEGWTIANATSGGTFETVWNAKPLTISETTKLNLTGKVEENTKVDVYIRLGDEIRLIEWSGEQRLDAAALPIGKLDVKSGSNGWVEGSINLGAALAKAYPGKSTWQVDEILIGARHGDPYRHVGFGGNPYGARYSISKFTVGD